TPKNDARVFPHPIRDTMVATTGGRYCDRCHRRRNRRACRPALRTRRACQPKLPEAIEERDHPAPRAMDGSEMASISTGSPSGLARCWPALLAAMFCLAIRLVHAASAQVSSGFVAVQGSRVYYEECGTGPQSVVLVHDGVLDSAGWNDVWPQFCATF